MTFKYSVVIPLYNKENYILKAINSVLTQAIACDDIIVVDDGSTDNSLSIVTALNNDNVKIISQANQGVSAARNTGIAVCKHEYILFLDADDIWLANFTAEIAQLATTYPEAGMLACAYAFKEADKIIPAHLQAVPENKGLIKDYFLACIKADLPITASSVAIKKEILTEISGFPLGMAMGEDQLVWSRIAYKYPIAFSNNIAMHYDRMVADSACKTHLITDLAPHVKTWQSDLKNNLVPKNLRNSLKELLHFSALYCVKNNLKSHNRKKAMAMLINEPLIQKDRYWLAGLVLACLPKFIINRVL